MSDQPPPETALPWPDHFHFDAAKGWIELGNLDEARLELEALTAESREFPAVLALDCHRLALAGEWQEVVAVAERWLQRQPGDAQAWVQRSYALHELRRTREAWDKLLPSATLFPENATIAYNLGCYACQLGELDTARRWLRRSFRCCEAEERTGWKAMARRDPDLAPLRDELGAFD